MVLGEDGPAAQACSLSFQQMFFIFGEIHMLKKLRQLALAFVILSAVAFAQGVRYDNVALLDTGRPANGATVRVCQAGSGGGTGCTPLASIYTTQALTVAKSNPFFTDARGNYGFYVAPGTYDIVLSGPGITTATFPTQQIGPSGTFEQNANGADFMNVRRFTDTASTGNFLHFTNAAGNTDLWTVDVNGVLQAGTVPASRIGSGTFNVTGLQLGGTTSSFPGLFRNSTTGTEVNLTKADSSNSTGVALDIPTQNTDGIGIGNSGVKLGLNAWMCSSGNALVSYATLSCDTGISRTAAGVYAIGNGTKGDASGTVKVANVQASGGTALALPTAGAAVISDTATQTLKNKTLTGAGSGNAVTLLNQQGAAGAITGNGAAQNLFSFSLPANTVQAGKGIRIKAVSLHGTGTAPSIYALKIGSTTIESFTLAPNNNTQADYFEWDIYNNSGVQNAQTWARKSVQNQTGLANPGIGASAGTAAVDLSSAQTITWSFSVANTDAVTPKFWSVELIQ